MKRNLLTMLLSAFSLAVCFAWGQKGHDVVCTIAQNHLSKSVQTVTSDIFDGRSLVYWSNWLDNASHTPEYAFTKTWHYKNVDAGEQYDEVQPIPEGNVITALTEQTAVLREYFQAYKSNSTATCNVSADQAAFALKCVIHLVGDLHQPMHMGHLSDAGGNRWSVTFFNQKNNLHSIWDSSILESGHKWSHTEWAEELDRYCDKKCKPSAPCAHCQSIVAGTFDDWGRETVALATAVYDQTPVDSKLSYDYVAQWTPLIEDQLLKAGLRLANLLNSLYK